jgi:predicted  nucleic acid-binding Zn-ribbon protein
MKAVSDEMEQAKEERLTLAREMRAFEGEIAGLREAITASVAKMKEELMALEREVKDNQ